MPNQKFSVPVPVPVPVPPEEIAQLLAVQSQNNDQMVAAIQQQLNLALVADGDRVAYDRGTAVINASAIRRDNAQNSGDQQVLLTHYREANQELMDLLIATRQRVATAQALAAAQRNVV
jgi:hypothetical protein